MRKKKEYRCHRVSMRLTEGEYRMLRELCRRGNFLTVSSLIRALLFCIVHDLRLACDGQLSLRAFVARCDKDVDGIGEEVRALFGELEDEGGQREWPADINGRR